MKKLVGISLILFPSVAFAANALNCSWGGGYMWAPFFTLAIIPVFGVILSIAAFIFWLAMLIDAIKNAPEKMKLIWVIVIVFTNIIGALIYYFMEKGHKVKHEHREEKKE